MSEIAISIGISIGISLASAALSYALTPTTTTEGPRLDTLDVPKSQFGAAIPKPFGTCRFKGCNVFWSPPLKEERKKRGGKGGKVSQKEYKYYGNFAALVCEGPIEKISRIWLNGQLYYADGQNITPDTQKANDLLLTQHLEIYLGTDTQNPDSTIQSFEGSDIPAFRKRVYLVFRDLPLENFGNRIPAVDVEVVERTDLKLKDLIKEISVLSGINAASLKITNLDTPITGYIFRQDGTTPRSTLEQLQQVFLFLGREKNSFIDFYPIEDAVVVATIPQSRLGTEGTEAIYTKKELSDRELPSEVQLEYYNQDNNHEQGIQGIRRASKDYENVTNIRTSLISDDGTMAYRASLLLSYLWMGKTRYENVSLLPLYFKDVSAGDLVELDLSIGSVTLLLNTVDLGANYRPKIEGVVFDADIDHTVTIDVPSYNADTGLDFADDPTVKVYDIPLLNDNDAELAVRAGLTYPNNTDPYWPGGVIAAKIGNAEYESAASSPYLLTTGNVATPLASGIAWQSGIDTVNSFTVVLNDDENPLSSVTDDEFLAHKQRCILGNEVIPFRDAVLIAPRTYTISHFLRGTRGTEWAISTHTANETFTLIDDALSSIPFEVADLGSTANFKGVPNGRTVDSVLITANHVILGNALKPHSPVNASATKNPVGDIQATWVRRDRKAGNRTDYANFPLSEAFEKYEIEILNGATVVRTLTSDAPVVSYMASQQVTDFGAVQNTIALRIYQISGTVGRGYPLIATLTPTLAHPVPVITGFSPTQGSISQVVTVYGSGFSGATLLAVNGTACTSVSIISDSEIRGTIAPSTTSGFVTVTTPGGTATSLTAFVITANTGGLPTGGTVGQYLQKTGPLDFQANWVNLGGNNPRERLTGERTYYVATTGNDNNDGLAVSTPLLTIKKAFDLIKQLDANGYRIFISVADGTYSVTNEDLAFLIAPPIGAESIHLVGNETNPNNVTLSITNSSGVNRACVRNETIVPLYVRGFRFIASGSIAFAIYTKTIGAKIFFANCNFGACTRHLVAHQGSLIESVGNYSVSGGGDSHMTCWDNGIIQNDSKTVTFTNSISFADYLYCNTGVAIVFGCNFVNKSFVSGRRFNVELNGTAIGSGLTSSTYLPGSVSGITTSGGQVS